MYFQCCYYARICKGGIATYIVQQRPSFYPFAPTSPHLLVYPFLESALVDTFTSVQQFIILKIRGSTILLNLWAMEFYTKMLISAFLKTIKSMMTNGLHSLTSMNWLHKLKQLKIYTPLTNPPPWVAISVGTKGSIWTDPNLASSFTIRFHKIKNHISNPEFSTIIPVSKKLVI